jgi:adenylylsulfate kinase
MSHPVPITSHVARADREQRHGHPGRIVWLTGLSGAGKSTLAMALERRLFDAGRNVCVLDGDIVRGGLCSDLGFSSDDRVENIRRIGEVARIMSDAGLLVIVAFISPFRADRDRVRAGMPDGRFTEVHVSTPLEVCEQRDTKGLYAKARAGELSDFTGITSPYEAPESPEVRLPTEQLSVDECVDRIMAVLA